MFHKENILLLSLCMVFASSINTVNGNWLISCKPCVDVINACIKCSPQQNCMNCVQNMGNTQCDKCFFEIFAEGDSLNCNHDIPYQYQACTLSCNARKSLNGACDLISGRCICKTF